VPTSCAWASERYLTQPRKNGWSTVAAEIAKRQKVSQSAPLGVLCPRQSALARASGLMRSPGGDIDCDVNHDCRHDDPIPSPSGSER